LLSRTAPSGNPTIENPGKQIKEKINLDSFELYGELGLNGSLRATEGLLPAIIASSQDAHNVRSYLPPLLGRLAGARLTVMRPLGNLNCEFMRAPSMEFGAITSSMSQLSQVFTRASTGLEAPLVTIEVHISSGLPGFSIVGLPIVNL
jgi:hypothetical protein